MGRVLRDGDRVGLRFRRELAHPRERVWRALTGSDDLRHWFPADVVGERVPGAALEVRFWDKNVEGYGIEEEVLTGVVGAMTGHHLCLDQLDERLTTGASTAETRDLLARWESRYRAEVSRS
ncbi:MAG TPA: hypothetical protein VGE77_03500 [Nocardioides sp.]